MPDDLLTIEQFGAAIKAKYPDYASVPDAEIGQRMLQKYPEYQDRIKVAPMNTAKVNGATVPVDEPNTIGTFARHVGEQINPITAAESIGGAVMHPIDTVKNIGAAQGALFDKAKASYDKGDYGTAARHFVDYLLPLVGPTLDKAADRTQSGQMAAGVGDAVGLGLAMFGGPAAAKGASKVVSAVAGSDAAKAVAEAADTAANRRVVDVIAPKVGPNKARLGNMAADVAPAVARETTGLTRSGIADSISGKLDDATAALDDAANQRLNARTVPTRPILDALQAARDRLTAQAVQGSKFTPQAGVSRPPIGNDVVPGPNAGRVAQIDQAIREVKQLGPVARYEPLRRIREAYDQVARVKYSPSMTADFLAKQGEASGAADVTGAVRDFLAKLDPGTAKANANYSLWKKADTVIQAAEEMDRVRPTVGRTIFARGLGAAAGAAEGGGIGAVVGAILGPMLERAATSLAPAAKLTLARNLSSLADAIRAGQATRAQSILQSLQRTIPAGAVLQPSLAGAAATPTGAQTPGATQ